MKKNTIKAIIFDYDGVIVDSFPSVFEVYKVIAAECGGHIPNDLEEFRELYGYDYRECLRNLDINDDQVERTKEIYKREIVKQEHKVFTGLFNVVRSLSKKYKLFVVSAAYKDEIDKNLNNANLKKYFSKIYYNASRTKKSERMANLLKEYHLSPDEVITIGDRTVDYDIAKKLGWKDENIIIVSYGWEKVKSRVRTNNIVNRPYDILKIIKI